MADQPPGQSCENCRYATVGVVSKVVRCRRYPAVVAPAHVDEAWADPITNAGDWCGEYACANPETFTDGEVTLARLILLGDRTAARALADKLRED